jgi:hypothetical protein
MFFQAMKVAGGEKECGVLVTNIATRGWYVTADEGEGR